MTYSDEVVEEKKKRNGTFSRLSEQPTVLVSETRHPGHPVSKGRGRGGVRGESSREQEKKQSKTERHKRAEQ